VDYNSTPTYVLKTGTGNGHVWSIDKHETEASLKEEQEKEEEEEEEGGGGGGGAGEEKEEIIAIIMMMTMSKNITNIKRLLLGINLRCWRKAKVIHCILFTSKLQGNYIHLRSF
jgi:hypothetical protein